MPDLPPILVCDLDGTLVDSAPDIAEILNVVLAEAGRPTLGLDQVQRMIGDGIPRLVERAFASTGEVPPYEVLREHVQDFLDRYGDSDRPHRDTIFPGVTETLADLRRQGVRLVVCTNKDQHATEVLLGTLGIGHLFDAVVGGNRPRRKPDAAHVIAAVEAIGSMTEGAVMVGDSPNDVTAARGAGLPVVCVTYGYSRVLPEELGADTLVDAFAEVPEAVRRLHRG